MAEEKEGGAEGAAGAIREAEAGVEVAGDAWLIRGDFIGIVGDEYSIDLDGRHGFDSERMLEEASHAIVISLGKGDGNGDASDPFAENIEDMRAHSIFCVDEIACDDEVGGLGFLDEAGEFFEVILAIAFRDGDAAAAEGGGFPKMDIRDDQGRRFFQAHGMVGEEGDLGFS